MSCADDPNACDDVLHDVWMFLDNELDPERRARVQRHLDDCSPCLEEAGIDSKLKALLARKCGGDHAPEQLRTRIAASLVQQRIDVVDDQGRRTRVVRRAMTVQWGSDEDGSAQV